MTTKLRIGSRGSQLALWQANHISALLRVRGHEIEIEIIHTTGDKITDVALAMVGTKGMFTKEIEEALAAGRVYLAVHSLKDLPTELPPGFEIAAITDNDPAKWERSPDGGVSVVSPAEAVERYGGELPFVIGIYDSSGQIGRAHV